MCEVSCDYAAGPIAHFRLHMKDSRGSQYRTIITLDTMDETACGPLRTTNFHPFALITRHGFRNTAAISRHRRICTGSSIRSSTGRADNISDEWSATMDMDMDMDPGERCGSLIPAGMGGFEKNE